MSTYEPHASNLHSPAWVALTKIQFGISVSAMTIGLWYLPVDPWIIGYLVMGNLLMLSSAVALSKTMRDLHEGGRIVSKVEDARLERILTQKDPFAEMQIT